MRRIHFYLKSGNRSSRGVFVLGMPIRFSCLWIDALYLENYFVYYLTQTIKPRLVTFLLSINMVRGATESRQYFTPPAFRYTLQVLSFVIIFISGAKNNQILRVSKRTNLYVLVWICNTIFMVGGFKRLILKIKKKILKISTVDLISFK